MWLTGSSNQVNPIGGNLIHHLGTTPELQKQRLPTDYLYGQMHQMMKMLQIGPKLKCLQTEWTVQAQNIREAAAEEAAKPNKDDGEVDKDGSKQAKPKPKQTTCKAKGKQKGSSWKKFDLPDNNLDEYFGLSPDKDSQKTADVTPTETPKKTEGAKSKDVPKSASHGGVHISP